METVNDATMHVTETKTLCSSLTCSKTRNDEIITKEKEKELLYDNNEDGEDEDTLSDDSLRLKLSDDEAEEECCTITQHTDIEKTKSTSTEMESRPDVSSKDSSDSNIALRGENFTNGEVDVESNLSCVGNEIDDSLEDFTSDTVPTTDKFYSCQDVYHNGDNDGTMIYPFEQTLGNMSGGSQWPYSGHFGNYSRHGKRNSVPRPPYAQYDSYSFNTYADGHLNTNNSLYIRGRIPTRGYSLYHNKAYLDSQMPSEEETDDSTNNSFGASSDKSKSERASGIKVSGTISVQARTDSSDSSYFFGHNVNSDLHDGSEAREPVVKTVVNQNDILKNCNNGEESTDGPKCESSIVVANINSKSKEVDIKEEVEGSDIVNESEGSQSVVNSTKTENTSSDTKGSSTEIKSKNFDEKEKVSLAEVKNEAGEIKEGDDKNVNVLIKEKNDNDVLMEERKLDNEKNDHDVLTKGTKLDDEKNSHVINETKTAAGKKDDVSIEDSNKSEKDETSTGTPVEESAAEVSAENAENQTELPTCSQNDQVLSAVPNEVRLGGKMQKHCKEKIDEQEIDKCEMSKGNPLQSSRSSSIGELANNEKDKSGQSISQKKLDLEKADEQASKDSSNVVEASKTVDEKNDFDDHKIVLGQCAVTPMDKNVDSQDEKNVASVKADDNNSQTLNCLSKRTSTELTLDEMELSKRMRIGRRKSDVTNESSSCQENDSSTNALTNVTEAIDNISKQGANCIGNTVTNSNTESLQLESDQSVICNNVAEKSASAKTGHQKKLRSETPGSNGNNGEKINDCDVIEVPVKRRQKRTRRSLNTAHDNVISQEEAQEPESVRQKRKTAKNAEEIIRKEFLEHSDSESNDSVGKFVAVNYNKSNNNWRAASPPTLKRDYEDEDGTIEGTITKKLKQDDGCNGDVSRMCEQRAENKNQILRHVRNFFRRDANGSLNKMKQEELEELLIQKVVETITMRDEIGKLREHAKISERNQEATRVRCQQLAKQMKDFEMVLSRYKSDLRANPESKTVVPIKINRSVGLQVNFVTDHGIQNLRQLQQVQKAVTPTINGVTTAQQQTDQLSNSVSAKRAVKVRSPRRPEPAVTGAAVTTSTPISVPNPHVTNVTPAALVVSKSVPDTRPSATPAIQQTTVLHPQLISSSQTILVNGSVNQQIRQPAPLHVTTSKNNDLIDLTQEEEKSKVTIVPQNSMLTTPITDTSPRTSNIQNIAPRYHTVIKALPGNMAITAQPGIRVVQPASQPTPTALVNNMSAPRLTYVTMQGGIVPTRQVVITSTPTPIRPAPANTIRTTFPISGTISNSTVCVIPTSAAPALIYKHPAALPEPLNLLSNPAWKLPPPAPSLKISKVANGIVLSWNMALSDKYAEIASYQLYAYQEVSGIAPNPMLWKKVGDVRALPLPMACTLTQFSEGNNYYFAVRAVDKHSRLGQYSQPGNISL